MTVAFQRMFLILERWNNNQVTPSLSKLHELSYRSNITLHVRSPQRLHICIYAISRIVPNFCRPARNRTQGQVVGNKNRGIYAFMSNYFQ